MTSGYCPACERVVPIKPGLEIERGKSARYWIILPHPAPDDDTGGRNCDGTGKRI
jgi:hypothetical protein